MGGSVWNCRMALPRAWLPVVVNIFLPGRGEHGWVRGGKSVCLCVWARWWRWDGALTIVCRAEWGSAGWHAPKRDGGWASAGRFNVHAQPTGQGGRRMWQDFKGMH